MTDAKPSREEARALVARARAVCHDYEDLSTLGLERADMDALLALAERGAECVGATERCGMQSEPNLWIVGEKDEMQRIFPGRANVRVLILEPE